MSDDIKCCVDGCTYDAEIEVERKEATLWICGDHYKAFFQSKIWKACGQEFHEGQRVVISEGWADTGKEGRVLGAPFQIHENGNWWVPLVFDSEDHPDLHKARGLEPAPPESRVQFPGGCAYCHRNNFEILEVTDNPESKKTPIPGFQPTKDIIIRCKYCKKEMKLINCWMESASILGDT